MSTSRQEEEQEEVLPFLPRLQVFGRINEQMSRWTGVIVCQRVSLGVNLGCHFCQPFLRRRSSRRCPGCGCSPRRWARRHGCVLPGRWRAWATRSPRRPCCVPWAAGWRCCGHRRCAAGCRIGNGTAFRFLPEADDVVLGLAGGGGQQVGDGLEDGADSLGRDAFFA